jgi:hypothetical protein
MVETKRHFQHISKMIIASSWMLLCPTWEQGVAWVLRKNGVSLGKEGKGGPGPPRSEGDKQSVLNKGRDNMERTRRNRQVRRDEEGSARTE